MSSALPTHQAYAPQPCLRTILDDEGRSIPATVHALKAHRLRVKPYSSHSASIALLVAISFSLSLVSPLRPQMYRGSAGQ
ncbi:uncharacterized protein Bfra_006852 [Botrytis fragariae]|uniref:Uncharacterized protein n=2 Tax=Botrytis TaxID=33196 RepID=A0A8H6EPP4_9HELO|nr:uncharacterized protein Bfra_006852 [Botrytis fragariae]KAF5879645.1 hypothetical protein Bfra_006852 [Botrytis fragariae]TGO31067.1 hypothetical protein BPAE_0002g01620 [Botrytis paeoniae]